MHKAITIWIKSGLLNHIEGLYLQHIFESTSKNISSAITLAGYQDIQPFFQALEEEVGKESYQRNNSLPNLLISDMTFDTLVEFNGNQSAIKLALKACDDPSPRANLFIHSGRGQGKTHLLNAIRHQMQISYPTKSIAMVNMLELAVALLRAEQRGIRENFIEFLSQLNCLLIDDIQHCEATRQIQVDLLQVINNHTNQPENLLVASADVVPGELQLSEPALKVEMEKRITVELSPPDKSERIQLLRAFAKNEDISSPVMEYIAENCDLDIRGLKATIIHLVNISRSIHKTIDLDLAKNTLSLTEQEIPQAIHQEEICSNESPDPQKSDSSRRRNNLYSQLLKEMIQSAENDEEHMLAQQIAISQMVTRLSQAKSPENRTIIAELQLALQSIRDGDLATASKLIQDKG